MDRKTAMHDAFWYCRAASESFCRTSMAIDYGGPGSGSIYEDMALQAFSKAADALGYDLVKRETKQEAA